MVHFSFWSDFAPFSFHYSRMWDLSFNCSVCFPFLLEKLLGSFFFHNGRILRCSFFQPHRYHPCNDIIRSKEDIVIKTLDVWTKRINDDRQTKLTFHVFLKYPQLFIRFISVTSSWFIERNVTSVSILPVFLSAPWSLSCFYPQQNSGSFEEKSNQT